MLNWKAINLIEWERCPIQKSNNFNVPALMKWAGAKITTNHKIKILVFVSKRRTTNDLLSKMQTLKQWTGWNIRSFYSGNNITCYNWFHKSIHQTVVRPQILFLIFYTILKPTKKLVVQRFGARASIRLYHFESGIVRVVNLPVDDILPTIDLLWLFTFLETELKLVFIQFFHPLLGPLFVIFLFPFPQFDYWMPVCCNLLMHICLLKWTNVSENPWWKYTNDTSRQHQTLVCRC